MDGLQIFDCVQGEPEWFECRRGIVTASRFADVLAKGRGKQPSKTRKRYLYELLDEIISGELTPSVSTANFERGHVMEDDARNLYAFARDVEPVKCGFLRMGRAGCSPDSLIDDSGMLEIKSKLPYLHWETISDAVLPVEHEAQVQGQLWVSGREWCDFISYWPRRPLFVKRVDRDEKYIATLAQAVADFVGELDALVAKYSPQEMEKAA
jgi:hypothetical protein